MVVPAGGNFTVTAKARDANGNVMATYNGPATWSDLSGTLAPPTPADFVNGVSTTTTANIPAAFHADTITVTTSGVPGTSQTFNVLGPLDHINLSVASQLSGTSFTANATAFDAANNQLTTYNAPATWSDLSGTLSPSPPSNFVNGVSSTTATISSPYKADKITITSGGVSKTTAEFNVFGPLDHIAVLGTPPSFANAGDSFQVKAYAYDSAENLLAYNNPASWSDLSGTLTPGTPSNFVNGVSTTTASVTSPYHADKITVTSGLASGQSKVFNVIGPLDHIAFTVGLQKAGVEFVVKATAYDSGNNVLPYYAPATWSDLSGTLVPSTPHNFANGVSTSSAKITSPFRKDKLTITTGGVSGTSGEFNVLGPLDHLGVVDVSTQTAGSPFTVTANAFDSANNPLTAYNGSATWSDLSGTLGPPAPSAFVNGVSSTTTATVSSPYHLDTITVSSGGANGTSKTFNVLGPLDHIGVPTPMDPNAGAPFTIKAFAYDSANNNITTFNGPASWSDLSGELTGAPTTFVNGVSQSSSAQIADPQHSDQLTASSGPISGQSGQFNVIGPLHHLNVTGPTGPKTTGQTFTVTADARDAANNLLTGYGGAATWSDLSGSLSPSTPSAFVNGVSKTLATSVGSPQAADTITIMTSGASGTSSPFDVFPPNTTPTNVAVSPSAVDENLPSGSTVGTLSTTDPDVGQNYTYSLVSGSGSANNASFSISGSTLLTAATFDFEAKSSYSIRVRTTDDGFPVKFFEKQLIISVNNLNEAPTNISLSASSIAENKPSGTTVGTLSATDPDSGQTQTFTLENTGCGGGPFPDNGSFTTIGSLLKSGASFDFETKSSYTICVRTTDSGSPALSFDKQFTVSVTNVNEAPSDIALSSTNVDENLPSGTSVGTLSSTDQDAGDTFTYSLVSGTGSADNGSFTITGSTLQTAAAFNFEAKSSYAIRIRTTDSAANTFEKQFTITVNNRNDAPTNVLLSSSTIAENQPALTAIGTLSATDEDAGQTYAFTLQSGGCGGGPFPDNSSFSIAGSSLKSAVAFNFEAKSSYTICVRTTDNGTPNLSFDKQLTITVTDVNDAPVANADSYTGAIGNTVATLQHTAAGPRVQLSGNLALANDTDEDATFPHTVSAVAETNASAGGGSAQIFTDGSFVYTPPVGSKNTNDTFTYHVTDGSLTTAGTVTVHIDNFLVWYVDAASAAATHDGRSSQPFLNLNSLNAAGGAGDSDGTGDFLFLYSGTYTGGLPLEAGQNLWGQTKGLTVNGISLVAAGGTNPVIQNGVGAGIQLANGVDVQGINVSSTGGAGIFGSAVTTATVGTSVAGTITNTTGDGVNLSGAAGGDISIASSITKTGSNHSVSVANRSSGTVAFSGAINDTAGGIGLGANTGATINFTGGVVVSSGTNAAFSATGGGTVSVTGANNTLATTTGTALNVSSTTIGASGLTFKSISSNGAVDGINLNATGSSGGLTVTGTGTAGTGGTIQNSTDSGILGNSTKTPSLSWMTISNNGNAVNEGGVRLTNVTGTGGITSSTMTGGFEDNVYLKNDSTTATFTVQGPTCSVTNNNSVSGNNGVNLLAATTANLTTTVNNCSFSGNRAVSIGADAADSSTLNVTITNNTITQGSPNHGNQGIQVSDAGNGNVTFDVESNKVGTADGTTASPLLNTGINVFNGSAGNAFMSGKVLNNVVLNDPTFPSSTSNGFGIRVFNSNLAQIQATVSGNTVKNVTTDYGILAESSGTVSAPSGSHGRLDVQISGNNTDVGSGALDSIRAQARNFNTVCARVSANTTDAGGAGFFGIFVRQANSALFNLEGGTAALAANNPSAASTGFTGTITTVAANTCTTP